MKKATLLVLAAFGTILYLASPADSNKCYQCVPCGDTLKDDQLTPCPDVSKACGKFVSKDDKVYRSCVPEEIKKEFDGKCDIKLGDIIGGKHDEVGCAYGCIGDGCNSAPSAFTAEQWKILLISLFAAVGLVLL